MLRERGVPAAVKHRLLQVARSSPQLAFAPGLKTLSRVRSQERPAAWAR